VILTRFADITIIGVNNNESQGNRARDTGLPDQGTFVKGDSMKLSEDFGENYFDAVYAPIFEDVCGEIMRLYANQFAEIFLLT
jgi:sterol 24-C-methyltransferase